MRLKGPWRTIQVALWLIGLAILAWKGWWWPGILVLVALSAILQAVIKRAIPEAVEREPEPEPEPRAEAPVAPAAPAPAEPPAAAEPERRANLLPATCPGCAAQIREEQVEWTGPRTADCRYCGTRLPMRKP
jgi:hypothetical protein